MRLLSRVICSDQPIRSRSCSETSWRRPMKRTWTPSSSSSGVSESISSANIDIRPSTSSAGRDQFSVENA
jgi:hypothetical protein